MKEQLLASWQDSVVFVTCILYLNRSSYIIFNKKITGQEG